MQTGANAGRLLCSYLSAKPLLMVPQMRSHSWLIPPLQYVLIASGFASLSKRSGRYLRSASRRVDLTACCHQEEVWLPSLRPGPADWVLGNHSPGVAGACSTFLWSDLITNTTRNVFTFFFLLCELHHAAEEPRGRRMVPAPEGRGSRWGRQLDLLHLAVMSCWISSYTMHTISMSIQESIQSTLLCHSTFIANGDYIF